MTNHDIGYPTARLACDLSALPPDQRAGHIALVRALFGTEDRVRRIENGIETSLASERLADAVSFIENERRCCRHLAFTLDVPADHAPLTLRVVGPGAAEELEALVG